VSSHRWYFIVRHSDGVTTAMTGSLQGALDWTRAFDALDHYIVGPISRDDFARCWERRNV
jgi:hypothetical protein